MCANSASSFFNICFLAAALAVPISGSSVANNAYAACLRHIVRRGVENDARRRQTMTRWGGGGQFVPAAGCAMVSIAAAIEHKRTAGPFARSFPAARFDFRLHPGPPPAAATAPAPSSDAAVQSEELLDPLEALLLQQPRPPGQLPQSDPPTPPSKGLQ